MRSLIAEDGVVAGSTPRSFPRVAAAAGSRVTVAGVVTACGALPPAIVELPAEDRGRGDCPKLNM
jgi:hypothetical protein